MMDLTNDVQMSLTELGKRLTFDKNSQGGGLERLRESYYGHLKDLLSDWVGSFGGGAVAEIVFDLSDKAKRRFLESPSVSSSLLSTPCANRDAQILQSIVSLIEAGEFENNGIFLERGIVFDFGTSFRCPPRSRELDQIVDMSTNESDKLIERIESLFVGLDDGGNHALELVRAGIVYGVFRQVQNLGSAFASGSFKKCPGLMYVYNPALINDAFLMDSLIHESVHGVLYYHEVLFGDLCTNVEENVLLVSPWTGKSLSVDQYVQANFVWWALYNFWSTWPDSRHFVSKHHRQRMLERASIGLEKAPLVQLEKYMQGGFVSDRAALALQEIQSAFEVHKHSNV
jgi:hypothetical protein